MVNEDTTQRQNIEPGVQCALGAKIQTLKSIGITVAEALQFAKVGIPLKTSLPIWVVDQRLDIPLTELT